MVWQSSPGSPPTSSPGALRRDGWALDHQTGSHAHYRHPTRSGTVTIPMHKAVTIAPKTLQSMLRAAGLTPEDSRRLL